MDNAQKAIMIGVGLFITIIIISAVLLITRLGTDLVDSGTGELSGMTAGLQSQLLSKYDGKDIIGSQLLAGVQQYEKSTSLCIMIINVNEVVYIGAGTTKLPSGTTKTKFDVGGIPNVTYNTTESTESYASFASKIEKNKYYKTALIYDTNNKVIGFAAINEDVTEIPAAALASK